MTENLKAGMQKAFGSGDGIPGQDQQKFAFGLGPDSLTQTKLAKENETKRANLKDFFHSPLCKTTLDSVPLAQALVKQLPENQIQRLLLLQSLVSANMDIRESINSSTSSQKKSVRLKVETV
jgi:hypothetical protein